MVTNDWQTFHEGVMTWKHSPHHNGLDSKVRGANMGPIWGRQDPGGPHVGPTILAIWGSICVGTDEPLTKDKLRGSFFLL